jgi:histone H3/H4
MPRSKSHSPRSSSPKRSSGVTNPELRRLGYVAGVGAMSKPSFEHVKDVLNKFLHSVLKDSVTYAEHMRHKLVSQDDVAHAVERQNLKIYTHGEEKKLSSCAKYASKKDKKVKSHKGTVMLRKIKFYQKKSADCLHIAKQRFRRLVKELTAEHKADVKFSSNAMGLLQVAAEQYLIELLQAGMIVVAHVGRKTLDPEDLIVVMKIRKH